MLNWQWQETLSSDFICDVIFREKIFIENWFFFQKDAEKIQFLRPSQRFKKDAIIIIVTYGISGFSVVKLSLPSKYFSAIHGEKTDLKLFSSLISNFDQNSLDKSLGLTLQTSS